jgi:hypothetical protein
LGNNETFEMDKYYMLFPDLVEKIHYNLYFSVNLNKIFALFISQALVSGKKKYT